MMHRPAKLGLTVTEVADPKEQGLKALMNIYLCAPENLEHDLNLRFGYIADSFGASDCHIVDDEALEFCLRHFRQNCLKYWKSLGVAEPSHLKTFGYLLYSLTQLRDGAGNPRRVIVIDKLDTLKSGFGDSTDSDVAENNSVLAENFHAFACFSAVYQMLVIAQRMRKEPLRFDVSKPPSSRRFSRSMVDYLVGISGSEIDYVKSPFDLYMIFKAMDLYGVDSSVP